MLSCLPALRRQCKLPKKQARLIIQTPGNIGRKARQLEEQKLSSRIQGTVPAMGRTELIANKGISGTQRPTKERLVSELDENNRSPRRPQPRYRRGHPRRNGQKRREAAPMLSLPTAQYGTSDRQPARSSELKASRGGCPGRWRGYITRRLTVNLTPDPPVRSGLTAADI